MATASVASSIPSVPSGDPAFSETVIASSPDYSLAYQNVAVEEPLSKVTESI